MACNRCGNCCIYTMYELWQLKHDLRWIKLQDGFVSGNHALIPNRCKMLTDENLCSIYDDRPDFCRDWPGKKEDCNPEWLRDYGCKYFED